MTETSEDLAPRLPSPILLVDIMRAMGSNVYIEVHDATRH